MAVDFAGKRKMEFDSDDTSKSGKSLLKKEKSGKSKRERMEIIREFGFSVSAAVSRTTDSAPLVATTTPAEGVEDFNRLYLQTTQFLLQLDLKNSNSVPVPFSAMKKLPPRPNVAVNYDGVSFPFGMGVTQTKSDIYILGGKYVDQGQMFDCSNKVFKFHPGDCSLKEAHMLRMKSAKAMPIVELIQGKIYVLQRSPLFRWPFNDSTFEVLDVSSALPKWKKLPSYDDNYGSGSAVSSHFVFRNKLYVFTRSGKLQYFDTCNESWHEEKILSEFFSVSHLLIPSSGRMLSEDVIIALKGTWDYDPYVAPGPRLQLMGYLYSKDGCLLACQALKYVFPVELYAYSHHLISMEDGKFCALTVGSNSKCPILYDRSTGPIMVLAVSIFSVRKLARADEIQAGIYAAPAANVNFLSVQVEKQYVFPVKSGLFIEGAFFA